MSHEHTLENFRQTMWLPNIWDHANPDTLTMEKQTDMLQAAREEVRIIWSRDNLYCIDEHRARAIDQVVAAAERTLK